MPYKGGRIKKIKIKNFMTYDNVEIHPKKGLNLIVGLNGSGKSSIMCAICLGLAGKPQLTGRPTPLSDFIKHGHQEAEIEIELESGKKSMIIHRKLKHDNSEWTLNRSPSNQNEVASAVSKFNIDTSNLCQFLPQEKVVEFSKMDKKQRLENMLQAIGEPHLFELFNELKDLHKKVTEVERTVKACHNEKNAAIEENDKICDEVHMQESRTRLKGELEELYNQKKIRIYQDNYAEWKILNERKKTYGKEVQGLRAERNEAVTQEDNIFMSYQKSNKMYQQNGSKKKNVLNRMNGCSNDLIKLKEQVENAKIEYRNKLNEKEKEAQKFNDLSKQISFMEIQLQEENCKSNEYEETEKVNLQALTQLQKEISELYQDIQNITIQKNNIDYSLKDCKSQLSSLQDEQNKKLQNLKIRDRQTHIAACWLLENQSRFNKRVFLPIMYEININSQENSKYVENSIGLRDMIAFVCEDKGDCKRLTQILRTQKNLPVNIVMTPDPSSYESPVLTEAHKKYGLKCFVSDLFDAPEPIMRYLCHSYKIHRIPVATSAIPGSGIEFILKSFGTFFSENTRISSKRSRYGNQNLSIKKDFIQLQNLLVNSNNELQTKLQQQCRVLEEDQLQKNEVLVDLKAQLDEKEKSQALLRQEKRNLQERKKKYSDLGAQLKSKKDYLAKIFVTTNEEEEKDKIREKVLNIHQLRKNVLGEFYAYFEKFIKLEKEILLLIMNMNHYSTELKLTKAANENIHDQVKAAEARLAQLTKEVDEKRRAGELLAPEIMKMGTCQIRPEMSVDDIDQRINHIQAQLNLNEDNEALVEEYNERKINIEKIEMEINKFKGNANDLKDTIKKKKEKWLKPLEHHIKNINIKFSHYFKELNCVGEISLDIPENSDDFTKYGLRISLKFHDEESSLCELSQTRHSGGECSVAAIIFILSLQELTEVPFRCIDEINQGMDSVNERKIYQLISDSVADDRCSQYFLLTPKLLMDLEYTDDVAIHIIFNSPFLKSDLNVQRHLEVAECV